MQNYISTTDFFFFNKKLDVFNRATLICYYLQKPLSTISSNLSCLHPGQDYVLHLSLYPLAVLAFTTQPPAGLFLGFLIHRSEGS